MGDPGIQAGSPGFKIHKYEKVGSRSRDPCWIPESGTRIQPFRIFGSGGSSLDPAWIQPFESGGSSLDPWIAHPCSLGPVLISLLEIEGGWNRTKGLEGGQVTINRYFLDVGIETRALKLLNIFDL